jgi:molecular chaperone HtpG
MTEDKTATQYEFKAEVKQLLNILVHSLYTNREIFLRELISNASDALDKLRFESNRGTEIANNDLPLEIKIDFDKDAHTIKISDTGIGMTKEEIIENIGTIAKSGSADFLSQIVENKEDANNVIGKFGVGFYSVFMVADKVTVTSKSFKKDAPAIKWESDGLGSYEIAELDEDMQRGTIIDIHLNKESEDYADKFRLQQVIKKHSNFISFPIKLDNEVINTIAAIWREPKSSLKDEQYNEFYKFLTYDTEPPLKHIHMSIDAPIQFNSLLFIPKKNTDMFGMNRDDYGLDLYVRRVLIQHKNKDLLPEYLSFVKGVVDSEDLPLNISRETLQENLVFTKIATSVTNQVLSFLKKLSKDEPDVYKEFWKEHSKYFKLGYTDFMNKDKYMELLRFNSSVKENANDLTSFDEYIERAKDDQKEIYYISGNSRDAINLDPHLEIFRKKGIEVLYLYDPIDEFIFSSISDYKEYNFKSVDQADLKKIEKFDSVEEEKEKAEELTKDEKLHFDSMLERIKEILGDKVTEVKISERLQNSPACLVNPDDSMSASMQKIMNIVNKDNQIPKKIFEINKDHKLVRNLLKIFKEDSKDQYIENVVVQLYESALLLEGYLADPHRLVNRINSLLEDSSEWYTTVKKI